MTRLLVELLSAADFVELDRLNRVRHIGGARSCLEVELRTETPGTAIISAVQIYFKS